jgi:hypothetical protein
MRCIFEGFILKFTISHEKHSAILKKQSIYNYTFINTILGIGSQDCVAIGITNDQRSARKSFRWINHSYGYHSRMARFTIKSNNILILQTYWLLNDHRYILWSCVWMTWLGAVYSKWVDKTIHVMFTNNGTALAGVKDTKKIMFYILFPWLDCFTPLRFCQLWPCTPFAFGYGALYILILFQSFF